ncbi:MAG: peptidyl-prolyl cis-trans isomerase [Deltaproteobacteria bacterium]|nr:peptidyl-prolyl cis-trans isomerase [Deltaproteobacteria bacterium]
MKKVIYLLFVMFILNIACSEKDDDKVQEPGMIKQQPKQRSGINQNVIAIVGSEEITKDDFDKYLNTLPQGQREWANSPQGKKYIIDTLINARLIEQEFVRRGLDKNPDFINRIENYKKQLMTEFIQKDIIKEEIKISDEEAEKYYKEHDREFNIPEQVKVLDMVVAQEKEALDIINRLKKGEDFGTLAANLSIDPFTKSRAGDLPPFTRDARPDIAQAAFSAKKPNEIIGPIKTSQGYHIIKFIKKIPPQSRTFEEVKESLKARLATIKRNEIYQNFLKELREGGNIKINEEFIEGKKEQTPQQPTK